MKKILLFIVVTFISGILISQCTPDPQYSDSLFGAWPDTITNFPSGMINEDYQAILNIKVPDDAGVLSEALDGVPIDSGVVTMVEGLPPGLSYECNSHTPSDCTFLGDSTGCAIITGIPTQVGEYDLLITGQIWGTLLGFPTSVPLVFPGYKIIVEGPSGLNDLNSMSVRLEQNVPNPFADRTEIKYFLDMPGMVEISVSNMIGQEVFSTRHLGNSGENIFEFNAHELNEGIYIYSVDTGNYTLTKRMVVRR